LENIIEDYGTDMLAKNDERNELNVKHLAYPQPGDYWHEMFCGYLVILKVEADKIYICDVKKDIDSEYWEFDLEKSRIISKQELERDVKYSTIDGFVADVIPEHLMPTVRKWEKLGCPIWEEPAADQTQYREDGSCGNTSCAPDYCYCEGQKQKSPSLMDAAKVALKALLWARNRSHLLAPEAIGIFNKPISDLQKVLSAQPCDCPHPKRCEFYDGCCK
jgi:hypothetical protein